MVLHLIWLVLMKMSSGGGPAVRLTQRAICYRDISPLTYFHSFYLHSISYYFSTHLILLNPIIPLNFIFVPHIRLKGWTIRGLGSGKQLALQVELQLGWGWAVVHLSLIQIPFGPTTPLKYATPSPTALQPRGSPFGIFASFRGAYLGFSVSSQI